MLVGPALQHLSFAEVVGTFYLTRCAVHGARRHRGGAQSNGSDTDADRDGDGRGGVPSSSAPTWSSRCKATRLVVAPTGHRLRGSFEATSFGQANAAGMSAHHRGDRSGARRAVRVRRKQQPARLYVFTTPEFTLRAALVVVPLAITVLVVQNGQGVAVLRGAGHETPINTFAFTSGLFSLLNAAVGAVSACVTGPTNAILTSGKRRPVHRCADLWGARWCARCSRPR